MTDLTVVSWNVDGWHTLRDEQLALLDGTNASVAMLQEVTPTSMELLREAGWHGVAALELLPAAHTERDGVAPRFSCAVLARHNARVEKGTVLTQAPSPVRAFACDVSVDGGRVHVVSAALPPGSTWGRAAKVGQARTLSAHLESATLPVIVGMDRNGPRFERWEPHRTAWWREDDPEFFSDHAAHGLDDALDRWFATHPDRRDAGRAERPDGPRAISYLETRTRPPTPRRYDVIMASRDLEVLEVEYAMEASLAAGSDHGMVTARLATGDAPA